MELRRKILEFSTMTPFWGIWINKQKETIEYKDENGEWKNLPEVYDYQYFR